MEFVKNNVCKQIKMGPIEEEVEIVAAVADEATHDEVMRRRPSRIRLYSRCTQGIHNK